MVDAQPGFYTLERPAVPLREPESLEGEPLLAPDTPREVALARTGTSVPGIQLATYANAEVIELDVGGTAVMRRTADGAFNATQILKVAGLDRHRRHRVLEREIGSQFEKVQGGTNKYQGTWIPFSVAVGLSRQYNVFEQLAPLFEFDMTQRPALQQPGPAEIEERRRELKELQLQQKQAPRFGKSELAGPLALDALSYELEPAGDALTTLPPLEPSPALSDDVIDLSRDVVTELFITASSGEPRPLREILAAHGAQRVEINVPIDDAGHTALHWAAALGRVSLVADLISHGADPRRGNRKGESPLVRAVLVTNNSDNSTFGSLLDQLFPSLHLGDTQGRTVLHHIALTAGIPGRSDASRYYLEALLEWAVRRRGSGGVSWLADELVDVQDVNGDTALNIAARLGSRRIAQQLVDVGASVGTANRAGLRPTDFGIRPGSSSDSSASPFPLQHAGDAGDAPRHRRTGSRPPHDGAERRAELTDAAYTAVGSLNEVLQGELAAKDELLASVHAQLKAASDRLAALDGRERHLQGLRSRRAAVQARLASLAESVRAENQRFYAENPHHQMSPGASFDADQPFKVDPNASDDLRRLPPVLLQARIRAYTHNEQHLGQLRDDLKATSLDSEAQFRRVVAQCTSNEESNVDMLLEDLLRVVAKSAPVRS